MKRPSMVKRLLLAFTKSATGVRITVGEDMPTGAPDAVFLIAGRADAGLDLTLPFARRVDVQEKASGANGLVTFTFDPPFAAAPDVTPRVRGSTGLLGASCDVMTVTASQAVIRVNKIVAGLPVLAGGVTVSLRAEAQP